MRDTLVHVGGEGNWIAAHRLKGLFDESGHAIAKPHPESEAVAVPMSPPSGPDSRFAPSASTGAASQDERSGMSVATKVALGACGAIALIVIGLVIWVVATEDKWELRNASRVTAMLEEADRLQDP